MPASPPSPPADAESMAARAGLLAADVPGDNAAPLSVSELSARLKRTVEERFGFVRLRGELSGVKRAASGHLYACLKDEGAVIDAVMWRTGAMRLAFRPEDGVEVIATGKLTTFPGRSRYQIVVERMEIAGEGALLALLAKTRARLEAEGLFDPAAKRALPYMPGVIGVVTSPTGAVIRDILHRLADRFPSRVLVWPVAVQGHGAADQVAAAVRGFAALEPAGRIPRPDVVIVARGGGAIEDLWAFNEEAVVRAIAACTIPVISAVGHETDTTLADFAADLRAPTPTAAAELAVPVREALLLQLGDFGARQRRCALRSVAMGRERLDARVRRLPRPETLVASAAQRLDLAAERLRGALGSRALLARARLVDSARHLSLPLLGARAQHARQRLALSGMAPRLLTQRLSLARARFAPLDRLLPQLDPDVPLRRGFARVLAADARTLTSAAAARAERALTLRFADADLAVEVASAAPARPARNGATRIKPPGSRQGDLF